MKKYICSMCRWIYGTELYGRNTGTVETIFKDLPENWVCPVCGVSKEAFIVIDDY